MFVGVIMVMSFKIELTLATELYRSDFILISSLMVIVRVINHFCHFKSILRLLLLHHLRSNDKKDLLIVQIIGSFASLGLSKNAITFCRYCLCSWVMTLFILIFIPATKANALNSNNSLFIPN